MGFICLI